MTTSHAITTLVAFIFLVLLVYYVEYQEAPEPITITVEHRFVLVPPVELEANTPYIIAIEADEEIVGRYVSVDEDFTVQAITVYANNAKSQWAEVEP